MEREHRDRPTASQEGGEWQQYAGFSVFVERQPDGHGGWSWRTRLYHDESAEVIDVAGLETDGWLSWLEGRLPSAPPAASRSHAVAAQVGAVKVVSCERSVSGRDLDARIEVAVTLKGAGELSYAIGAAVLGAALTDISSPGPS